MVRISVIIPTRNREADLRRCLTGLAECGQRVPASSGVVLHQVVVVDDASSSPGATAAVIETGLPVTLLRNQRRLGAGASRRRAVEAADGGVLAFLDDDAVPRGDWLMVAATVHDTHPAITGRVLGFDTGLLSRARQARYDARYRGLAAAAPVGFFACGNSAVLTDAFHAVGGFANDGVGGDNSLAAALLRRGTPVRFQPDLVIAHRNGKGSIRAFRDAWSAGTNHPDRMTVVQLRDAMLGSAVGGTLAVRELNRALGIVHALGRVAPGSRPAARKNGHRAAAAAATAHRPGRRGQPPDAVARVARPAPGRLPVQVLRANGAAQSGTRCTVGVVGLGYAGLPQAIAFANAGHPVVGVDVCPESLAALRAGASPVETVSDGKISRLSSLLTFSGDAAALAGCSVVLICVPTPLDGTGRPDLTELRDASAAVAASLRPGQLVVVGSTVHPGVTDRVVKPILEQSGLRAGVHFSLVYAPERVDPGNPVFDSNSTPRVVGGLTAVCALRAYEVYRDVVPSVHIASGLREAEAAKMLENTYRQVNLALVHEFAAYCAVQGIDVHAVIDAAATKPFGFQPFYPGAGVGGHCIPVDPMYLAHAGRELGVPLRLVELAQKINNERPRQVADQCTRLLASAGRDVAGSNVLILGISYKPDVADVRNSPAVPLIRALTDRGIVVTVHDLLAPEIVVDGVPWKSEPDLAAAIHRADLVLVAQQHAGYRPELLREARLLHMADPLATRKTRPDGVRPQDQPPSGNSPGASERCTQNSLPSGSHITTQETSP